MNKKSFIKPPRRLPLFIKIGTWIAERKTKKEMLIPQILAWYPKAAVSSGILEAMITHHDKEVPDRLLQLVRLQVATLIGCSFCMDMNMLGHDQNKITMEELQSLQTDKLSPSFSHQETIALEMTRMLTKTPVVVDEKIIRTAKKLFSERAFVIICTTISQVNYWCRMIKGFGIQEACPVKR